MQDSIGVPVKHVSETAFMVAAWRAVESRRPDACFQDPLAELLAGDQGTELIKKIPGFESGDWFMALRTSAMDEMILNLVAGGVDTVLNLAAGLDSRPYRLALPPSLRWIEVDLPGIIEYKTEKLAGHKPRCQLERETVDLTVASLRDELFAEVAALSKQTLVITEGLLYYLTKEDVESLGKAILAQPSFRWWMMDIASPGLFGAMRQTWEGELATDDVRFKFMPEAAHEFYKPLGWTSADFRSYQLQGSKVGRTPPEGLDEKNEAVVKALEDSGILVLARA